MAKNIGKKGNKAAVKEKMTKVKDAAIELGFSSEYYFSRFFRRQTGMPPGQFQKLYGRGN